MKRLIAEFEEQSFTQIIFPHKNTDWIDYLQDAQICFINIINEIIKYQQCLVICDNISNVKKMFKPDKNLFFIEYETDDTWARDSSVLCVKDDEKIELLNFIFNAWGQKFEAQKDNEMNKNISKYYLNKIKNIDFILEGGAIESNGNDIILTTAECMLNKNRNKDLNKVQITQKLQIYFGAKNILYLNHGYLAGDDTDSHIDTLARFIDENTIMYIQCNDKQDEHYKELNLMERELKEFAKKFTLNLIPLPMCDAIYHNDERLPATYANFLFINGAILVPIYKIQQDEIALNVFKTIFKDRDIIGVDCTTLIKQHGSLHCVSMNFASKISLLV